MVGRSAALLVDLPVDLQPSGWRLVDRPGRDLARARAWLAQDLDALAELAACHQGGARERQADVRERSDVRAAETARALEGLWGLLQERRPRQRVHVWIEHERHHDDEGCARRRGSLYYKRTGSIAEVAELLGDSSASPRHVCALTD